METKEIEKERLTEWVDGKAIPRMDLGNNGYGRCMRKLALIEDIKEFKRKTKAETLTVANRISPEKLEKAGCPTDIYVQEKQSGNIHKLGTDPHDAIWVDRNGIVRYMNLQNGDGCSGDGNDEGFGYRFCASDCGELEEQEAK